ncbi:MAG: hypothetical protein ACRDAW_02430 [Metamycoplasmataceae bacterium]
MPNNTIKIIFGENGVGKTEYAKNEKKNALVLNSYEIESLKLKESNEDYIFYSDYRSQINDKEEQKIKIFKEILKDIYVGMSKIQNKKNQSIFDNFIEIENINIEKMINFYNENKNQKKQELTLEISDINNEFHKEYKQGIRFNEKTFSLENIFLRKIKSPIVEIKNNIENFIEAKGVEFSEKINQISEFINEINKIIAESEETLELDDKIGKSILNKIEKNLINEENISLDQINNEIVNKFKTYLISMEKFKEIIKINNQEIKNFLLFDDSFDYSDINLTGKSFFVEDEGKTLKLSKNLSKGQTTFILINSILKGNKKKVILDDIFETLTIENQLNVIDAITDNIKNEIEILTHDINTYDMLKKTFKQNDIHCELAYINKNVNSKLEPINKDITLTLAQLNEKIIDTVKDPKNLKFDELTFHIILFAKIFSRKIYYSSKIKEVPINDDKDNVKEDLEKEWNLISENIFHFEETFKISEISNLLYISQSKSFEIFDISKDKNINSIQFFENWISKISDFLKNKKNQKTEKWGINLKEILKFLKFVTDGLAGEKLLQEKYKYNKEEFKTKHIFLDYLKNNNDINGEDKKEIIEIIKKRNKFHKIDFSLEFLVLELKKELN